MVSPPHEVFLRHAVESQFLLKADIARARTAFSTKFTFFGLPVFQRNAEIAQLLYSKFGSGLPAEFYRAALFYSAPAGVAKKLPSKVQDILKDANSLAESRADPASYANALSRVKRPEAIILSMCAALNGLRKVTESLSTSPLKTDPALQGEIRRIADLVKSTHVPAAGLLGLHDLKNDLGESAFQVLDPDKYAYVDGHLSNVEMSGAKYLAELQQIAGHHAAKLGVRYLIKPRTVRKQAWSVYQKMERSNYRGGLDKYITNLHDVLAFKVVLQTSDPVKCHEFYRRLAEDNRLKEVLVHRNYLGTNRKPNGYEALHLEVKHGRQSHGEPFSFEIQVKTEEMERRSEDIAALHELYKGGGFSVPVVRSLQHIGQHLASMANSTRPKPIVTVSAYVDGRHFPISIPDGTHLMDVVGAVLSTGQLSKGFDVKRGLPDGTREPVHYSTRVSNNEAFHINTTFPRFKPEKRWGNYSSRESVTQAVSGRKRPEGIK